MVKLNKILTIPHSAFYQAVDLKIVEAVEKIVSFNVSHVKSKELKPEKGRRRFLVEEVYGPRDK